MLVDTEDLVEVVVVFGVTVTVVVELFVLVTVAVDVVGCEDVLVETLDLVLVVVV